MHPTYADRPPVTLSITARQRTLQAVARCAVLTGALLPVNPSRAEASDVLDFFERRIRPVLVEHCYECHSAEATAVQAGLRLDSAAGVRRGGDVGAVVVPGDPGASRLLAALRYQGAQMPPQGKLPESVIADFAQWIEMGVPDPRDEESDLQQNGPPRPQEHWAFQAPQEREAPRIRGAWARTPIDALVAAKQREAGATPASDAAPRDLLRRLYYDLVGLPPTASEMDRFAADPNDSAYESVVDALLDSPRFGERWARHWLDVARYADTKGYVFEEDRNYPGAYRYRDWVIESFNNDIPYDKFVVAQLVGDQVDAPEAMGYLTLGRRFLNNRHDIIDDRIDVVTRGMLGLTVACARCHDHKYDPIPTADYYSLYGVFASCEEQQREDGPPVLVDREQPHKPVVFQRGNPSLRGDPTPRRFLTCLAGEDAEPFAEGSGRRELAEAIASPENPLTARVWVNRVWGWLFGRSLVGTPSDFGVRGEPPTHPELLDYLATTLVEDGWSTKRLIRRIVTSSVYRQSCEPRAGARQVDPENRLYTRMNRRRLDLEASRDSVLAAAGRLDLTMGGPSQKLTEAPFTTRRAVYGFIERQNLPAYFRTFDFASPDAHVPARSKTTTPQQALFFLNSPFMMDCAAALAARSKESGGDRGESEEDERVRRMFRIALGRSPTPDELADVRAFLERSASAPAPPPSAWTFGWGWFDPAERATVFHELPHYTGRAWQGGGELPDDLLGWVSLSADGGHPGDPHHQAIRRWVAPAAGALSIEGMLAHPSDQGDGVRGRVVSSRAGVIGSWKVANGRATTHASTQAAPGDVIDFVTDCREHTAHDSFSWTVTISLQDRSNSAPRSWRSDTGFRGPAPPPLDRWGRLAQVLLMSNEFQFVD